MEFEKKNEVPDGIKILGWVISLFAFAIGFYHTAEGMKFFKPLGFEGGAFVVSALISMLLIVAYSRAVSGVKAALFFYLTCALFNFTFNLNSFYPNLNSRKLLQEEAQLINDTIQINRTLVSKLTSMASISDLNNLKIKMNDCLDEISLSKGFGVNAKKELDAFNNIAKKYGSPTISSGSYDVGNPNAANHFRESMESTINNIRTGKDRFEKVSSALEEYNRFYTFTNSRKSSDDKKTFLDSTMQEISLNTKKKEEDTAAFRKSINKLDQLVKINDQVAVKINKLNLMDTINGRPVPIKMKVFNGDKSTQLLYPKTQELGSFAHTLNSMWERINKIDTWGVIILVFFIDFIVPFAIYFMIRKKKNSGENDGMGNASSGGLFGKLFRKKQPEQF
jgi:hypothetical protein